MTAAISRGRRQTGAPAETVRWTGCAPVRPAAARAAAEGGDPAALRRPTLLRFASDTFMDDLAALLAADPGRLVDHVAQPVGFRERPPGAPDGWTPTTTDLTLYQPAHGHFNLVAAALVCRRPGLPDHRVRAEHDETTGFVLRRTAHRDGEAREQGWVPGQGWAEIGTGAETALLAGETVHPLFPVTYREGDLTRRMLAGLVPTISGEVAAAAPAEAFPDAPEPADGARPDQDPRWEELDRTVVLPLRALAHPEVPVDQTDDDLAEPSAFVVLDLADFLARRAPVAWAAVRDGRRPPAGPEQRLYDALAAPADTATALSWRAALTRAAAEAAAITGEAEGPVSLRLNVARTGLRAQTAAAPETGDAPGTASLQGLVRAVLPPADADPTPAPAPAALPKIDPTGRARYRIRCVYRRPRCAPWQADVVSEPSEEFGIASFFDPDAPARDIRIALPLRTGLKDLRKHRKGVGMMISDQLRGQLGRITDLKKALDGEIAESQRWELGMICQLSIPIITICALIVLFVFLVLLNIVFFWLPFFRICLPVPVRSGR